MTPLRELDHLAAADVFLRHMYIFAVGERRVSILAALPDIWPFCVCKVSADTYPKNKASHLHGWHACRTRLVRRSGVETIPFTVRR